MKTENTNPLSAIPFRNWMIALTLALLAACTSDSGNSWNAEDVCPESLRGNFQDKRDGKWYSYTTIGDQVWMAENLEYKAANSKCYPGIENYCDIYGRLYGFPDRSGMETVCPEGWHLPTQAEWEELIEAVGSKKAIDKGVLRAQEGWNLPEGDKFVGTNLCGFTALPGGGGTMQDFNYNKTRTYWWTATLNLYSAETFYMNRHNSYFTGISTNDIGVALIRCVKDK